MSIDFFAIRKELELMREELQERLFNHSMFDIRNSEPLSGTIMYHVKEELHDVEHALSKMNSGLYGICEETGAVLPLSSLKFLPTARSIHDFSYKDQYEKKSLPFDYTGVQDYEDQGAGEMVY